MCGLAHSVPGPPLARTGHQRNATACVGSTLPAGPAGRVERRRAGLPNTHSTHMRGCLSPLCLALPLSPPPPTKHSHAARPHGTPLPPRGSPQGRGCWCGVLSPPSPEKKERRKRERKKGGWAQQKIDPAPSSLFFLSPRRPALSVPARPEPRRPPSLCLAGASGHLLPCPSPPFGPPPRPHTLKTLSPPEK